MGDHATLEGGPGATNGEGNDIPAAQLAALDAQLRAHITRLMTVGGHDVRNVPEIHSAATRAPSAHVSDQDECCFDFVLDTQGIAQGDAWVPADGEERWEIAEAIATPVKDAEDFNAAASISCRVEVPARDEHPSS